MQTKVEAKKKRKEKQNNCNNILVYTTYMEANEQTNGQMNEKKNNIKMNDASKDIFTQIIAFEVLTK